MTTLETITGDLIKAHPDSPRQLTRAGRPSLSKSSVPLANWGGGSIALTGRRNISFDQLYRTQPMVGAVVNKLTRQISRIPLKVYHLNSQNDRERVTDGPLVKLLRNPLPRRGPVQLKQWLALPTLVHGNALVAKYRAERGGPPTGLMPLFWRHVTDHSFIEGGPIEAWETTQFGGRRFIDAAETIHVAWDSPDGNLGISALEQLGVMLRLDDAAVRALTSFHENGWRQSAMVVFPAGVEIDDDDLDELQAEIASSWQGIDNAGGIGVLTDGAKVETFSFNAQEAELVKSRQLSREEVCTAYDVPPPMVGLLDKATFSNIDTQHRMLFTDVLGPWLTLIEETIQAQLIDGEPEFEGHFVEFDLSEVLRGDPVAEIEAITAGISGGVLTPKEGRRIQNRAPTGQKGEDQLYLPLNNLQPLGTAAADEQ